MAEILIDFDGTVVSHNYPKIGHNIGAVPVLKALVANGHNLILFTMRSDSQESEGSFGTFNGLQEAVDWFKKFDIPLYGIQKNPTQHTWTTSPKAYGQWMIDDIAVGTPLMICDAISNRPFVDWRKISALLLQYELITPKDFHNCIEILGDWFARDKKLWEIDNLAKYEEHCKSIKLL